MAALTDKDKIPFGAHKDTIMEDVPASYLMFFWRDRREWLKMKYYGVYLYIKQNLRSIEMDALEESEDELAYFDHEDWGNRD